MRVRRFIITTAIGAFTAAGIAAPVALSAASGTVTAASHASPNYYYRA